MVGALSSGKSRSTRPGEPFVFASGGALILLIAMVFGVIVLLAVNGLGIFWPREVVRVEKTDGSVVLGQVWRQETIPTTSEHAKDDDDAQEQHRTLLRVGNRRVFGSEFTWVDDADIRSRTVPLDAVVIERLEWGVAIGILAGVSRDGVPVDTGDDGERLPELIDEAHGERLAKNLAPPLESASLVGTLLLSNGDELEIPLAAAVRAWHPNSMGVLSKLGFYITRIWNFMAEQPRESNTAGGIYPAIMGTILLVLIMTLAVVPLGVVGALYLNEYARQGPLVRLVRLAVSNLAGVPSIVFGMFGLAFFVYQVGKRIDQTFYDESAGPVFGTGGLMWAALTLALLTVPVVIVATEESLRAVPRAQREGSLALGATKWQALRSVVIPASLPGILTGMILAIARGAGEVAPLMMVGVAKLAANPLVDTTAPFLHVDRKFMHLGFHIYDVGFQSPNVEASKPMVYATALLLLVLVVVLNLCAILYRNRIRRRLAGSTF